MIIKSLKEVNVWIFLMIELLSFCLLFHAILIKIRDININNILLKLYKKASLFYI